MTIRRPDHIRNWLMDYVNAPTPTSIEAKVFGAVLGHMNKALAQFDGDMNDITRDNRLLVISWLFNSLDKPFEIIASTNELTPQQKNALIHWVDAKPQQTMGKDEWVPQEAFAAEARYVLSWARLDNSRVDPNGELVFYDLLQFWAKSGETLTEEDDIGISSLHIGGVSLTEPLDPEMVQYRGARVIEQTPVDPNDFMPV